LVIPDCHVPYHHPSALDFLDCLNERIKPELVISLGDLLDFSTISFHDKDPDMPFSPSSELEKSIFMLKDFYLIFPRMTVLDSNHDSLVFRRAKFAGLPVTTLKPLRDILEAPKGWKWVNDLWIKLPNGQKVYMHHGKSGSPMALSKTMAACSIEGHFHGKMGVYYWSNGVETFWGAHGGCLIDVKNLAFSYGRNNLPQPCLGAMAIVDSVPRTFPMLLDSKGKWVGKLPIV
jgi:hypothetical protein